MTEPETEPETDTEDGERCVCCGEVGHDRRTLWMACFYEMKELGLPFEEQPLFHAKLGDIKQASEPVRFTSPVTGKLIHLTSGTVTCSGELIPHLMYTLRVCKQCRGEWMMAIKAWFRRTGIREATKQELKEELRYQVEQELEAEVRRDLERRRIREDVRAELEAAVATLLPQLLQVK